MNTLRETQYHSHSHPQYLRLRGHHDATATNCTVAFGIIRAASCLVLNHAVVLRPSAELPKNDRDDYARRHAYQCAAPDPVHDLGRDSSHITLRNSASSSGDITASPSSSAVSARTVPQGISPAARETRSISNSSSSSSSSVAFVGVGSCHWSNRARCRRLGQGERFEQLFEEISGATSFPSSDRFASRSGPMKSPTSCWRKSSAVRNGRRNSGSRATAIRRLAPSWSLSMKSAVAAACERRV